MDDCCASQKSARHGDAPADSPLAWFSQMIPNCLDHAKRMKAEGKHIVGIMCEFTPREIIMAAGGVPVCLCGGSQSTIDTAEADLPANLCPLIKSTYGYHLKQTNPFLEMAELLVAETTCDGKKKMYELLSKTRPLHVLELPQKQDDEAAFDHWVSELRKLKAELEKRFDIEVTDAMLKRAIRTMNEERGLEASPGRNHESFPPPMTGRELIDLKSSISGIPCDFTQYRAALEEVNSRKPSQCMAKRTRVLLTGVPIAHGAERVLDIIEDHGGVVVAMENCAGLKPILDDVNEDAEDPLVAIAEKYFHLPCSVMTPNDRRMQLLRDLTLEYKPQCIIDLSWQACLTYDVESFLVRDLAEKELGVPFLRISTDYSPSDSTRIAVRVEALLETVDAPSV